jgi:radical SAM enzyme (TIGR01210 family)
MSTALRSTYPDKPTERDAWIKLRRPQRNAVDPYRPYAFLVEDEYSAHGEVVPVSTVFLTNRECPWRCLMCDLWKNTLADTVPLGAIPAQIDYALRNLPPARVIKLYNSGSFFDPKAIPPADYLEILRQVGGFERVIVECHPALIGENCFQFSNQLPGKLEVAIGLETAHPGILEKLNKRMSLDLFSTAAHDLGKQGIDLRVFILIKPPFMREEEVVEWSARSLDFAFDCGASAVTLIPTRAGNGALDDLAAIGDFSPPRIESLESAIEYGVSLARGRVFIDLWDTEKLTGCRACLEQRIDRLRTMNLRQEILPAVVCESCGVVK